MASEKATAPKSFTGRARQRKTSTSVKIWDLVAYLTITLGGIGTILAVVGVAVYLVWETIPLFFSPAVEFDGKQPWVTSSSQAPYLLRSDEYEMVAWKLERDGTLLVHRLDDGKQVSELSLSQADGPQLTAVAFSSQNSDIGLGFSDGTVKLGQAAFAPRVVDRQAIPPDVKFDPKSNTALLDDGSMAQLLESGQVRLQKLKLSLGESIKVAEKPIVMLDLVVRSTGTILCTFAEDNRLRMQEITERTNILTGETVLNTTTSELPYEAPAGRQQPAFLSLTGLGDQVLLLWKDGLLLRYDARNQKKAQVAEQIQVVEPGAEVTAVASMIGRSTLVVGDSQGHIYGFFGVKPDRSELLRKLQNLLAASSLTASPDGPQLQADIIHLLTQTALLPTPEDDDFLRSLKLLLTEQAINSPDSATLLKNLQQEFSTVGTTPNTSDPELVSLVKKLLADSATTAAPDTFAQTLLNQLHNWGQQPQAKDTDLQRGLKSLLASSNSAPDGAKIVQGAKKLLGDLGIKYTSDGVELVRGHVLPSHTAGVTSLGVSSRTRMVAAGYKDGTVRVLQMTNENIVAESTEKMQGEVRAVAMSPKDNGLLASDAQGLARWSLNAPHHEVTVGSLFAPVWYEGYEKPMTVWQSSSGDDAFEPKFGLYPLIFGTLKATFYCLLFGVPLALLAAIYTSEFLPLWIKSIVKPLIELMASLPSVVLGFLAAIVFAPIVEAHLPSLLMLGLAVPSMLLLGAYLWQMIPNRAIILMAPYRLWFVTVAVLLGMLTAYATGPTVEWMFFGGNVQLWLNGQVGTALGAWAFLWFPLSACVVGSVVILFINPRLRAWCATWSHTQVALLDLAKFVVSLLAVLLLTLLMGTLFTTFGWDPRGTWEAADTNWAYLGTYVQRNSLIVGIVMGFAVIPIIYTIAEDALSTVPQHLRSASLGSGATQWQTATRIVIPTAMSGLFSAVMIGLGRAVGETMIVLMAAGNTPVKDVNIFNGFRTLSANLAVELPEAVRHSTHYRTLFLAALTLFALTFLVNTLAETIRIRFRKRAFEL